MDVLADVLLLKVQVEELALGTSSCLLRRMPSGQVGRLQHLGATLAALRVD